MDVVRSEVLKESERGAVERVTCADGAIFIRRVIYDDMRSVFNALRKLDSPRFPRVESVELTDSTIVIEEYVKGVSLGEALITKRFSRADAVSISRQLIASVAELEKIDVVHRDIKPDNIIISFDGGEPSIRLIDFSIARIAKQTSTRDTDLLGTSGWAAPEQYGFSATDTRSDLYSAGLVIKKVCVAAGVRDSDAMIKFADRCSAFDPNARFAVASLALDALDRYRSRPRRVALAVTAAALAACAAAFFATHAQKTTPQRAPYAVYFLRQDGDASAAVLENGDTFENAGLGISADMSGDVLSLSLTNADGSSFASSVAEVRDGTEHEYRDMPTQAEILRYDLDCDDSFDIIVSLWRGKDVETMRGDMTLMDRSVVKIFTCPDGVWREVECEHTDFWRKKRMGIYHKRPQPAAMTFDLGGSTVYVMLGGRIVKKELYDYPPSGVIQ